MARTVEIVVPAESADEAVEKLRGIEGVVSLSVYRDASVVPRGTVLVARATNRGAREILDAVVRPNRDGEASAITSEPMSVVASSGQERIDQESQEGIWEEVALLLRRHTNVSGNFLLLMALSGAIAAIGLWLNHVHIVVGAMVLAPGFEPFLRIPMGVVLGQRNLSWHGALSSISGYLALAVGAAVAFAAVAALEGGGELGDRSWVQFWSTPTAGTILLSAVAGAAGALTVIAERPVFTAGVMIALSVVPGMSIAGMGIVAGDFALAGRGALRWAIDVVLVVVVGGLVVVAKQAVVHRRRALA